MTGTVFEIDTLAKQKFLCRIGAFEYELGTGGLGNPVLYGRQFDLENTTQVILNDIYFQTAGGSFGINGSDEMSI